MKIALLGSGKTGSQVSILHKDVVVFNSKNTPTIEKLKACDVIISFLSGEIFLQYIPLLIESEKPVITGSTGFDWPEDIHNTISQKNLYWVRAHNFSLGMNLVKSMIETLSKASELYNEIDYSIHDIHHLQKLDSPSGIAITWKNWLKRDASISAKREGDIVGYHHLEMNSPFEKIKITHEAKDRAIFAQGAIWAAKKILNQKDNKPGLIEFSSLVSQHLNI